MVRIASEGVLSQDTEVLRFDGATVEDEDGGSVAVTVSGGLPVGGTTGQVLKKASNADGDAGWEDESGGSQPGVAVVRGPFTITPDLANLSVGPSFPIIAVDLDEGTVTIEGDHVAEFTISTTESGTQFAIVGSTGNDTGTTSSDAVELVGGDTVITCSGLSDPTADGSVYLPAGHAFYTPEFGEILLDAFFIVDEIFDGSSNANIGTARTAAGAHVLSVPCDLSGSIADEGQAGHGMLGMRNPSDFVLLAASNDSGYAGPMVAIPPFDGATEPFPLRVWVTSDGSCAGAPADIDPGATEGSARLYIVTATPVAFS